MINLGRKLVKKFYSLNQNIKADKVRVIDDKGKNDRASREKIVVLVDQMPTLIEKLRDAKTDHE